MNFNKVRRITPKEAHGVGIHYDCLVALIG